MCGIFGIISRNVISKRDLKTLAFYARQRGRDSSGILFADSRDYYVTRADHDVVQLLKATDLRSARIAFGHSRLVTNGLADNQPVSRGGYCLFHNGIVVNEENIWQKSKIQQMQEIDSEAIFAVMLQALEKELNFQGAVDSVFQECEGAMSCVLVAPKHGKVVLFSNTGSLYAGKKQSSFYVASERYVLSVIGCNDIQQVKKRALVFDVDVGILAKEHEVRSRKENLLPKFNFVKGEDRLLISPEYDLKRCKKCVLTETMPFIHFDRDGICNYCKNYQPRNQPKPREEIFSIVKPYRRDQGAECIIPFSGGRDSCYGLHLVVNELKLKPITYTYDWGMVTDLGRRNISRMCAQLGVENIIVAADISQKRKNIRVNLRAWLKSPNLGMISILTAGDKHFFRHVETVKKQTGIELNLWGVNPLEVTHFKAGFLGIAPDFEERLVYSNGLSKQLRYQWLRFKAMSQSPGYFNSSLFDTLSGEYFRSFTAKSHYYHIFDYWRWNEQKVNSILKMYDWESAPDTNTTWRIGDGTAAFYNYIYHTVVGFTEHDTFRSNQIREGDITREKALELVADENRPRYLNIKWYLDAIGMDFSETISCINKYAKSYNAVG